ncbi:hypothetical protein CC80DRAFT_508183 [Byssothecium circinans]|uniref:Uncharacterized protein n=1 Tax=Byssothecium circinans TaxID=147558 RepID=A0A6A5TH66_9PLEO|nr:hypothetical protein CC80DRAFT_508183 [Byssothecium circinans]
MTKLTNFTFVTHKGARPEKQELVKPHLMRESQTKRREARQRRQHTLGGLPLSLPFHTVPPRIQPASLAQAQDFTPTDPTTTPVAWDLRREPLEFSSSEACASPQSAALKAAEAEAERRYRLPVGVPVDAIFSDIFKSHSSNHKIEEHQSPNGSGRSIYERLASNESINYWSKQAATSSDHTILVTAAALSYCAYRDTAKDASGVGHGFFKDRTLSMINRALEKPETATSDDNIAAVTSVCMYENVQGNNVIVTHLKGLRQMIDIRKSMNNLKSSAVQHMNETALLQDMMYAACSNMPPIMFEVEGPTLRDVRMGCRLDTCFSQSPLRVLNDAFCAVSVPELSSSSDTLKDAFDAFEMMCIEAFDPDIALDEAFSFKSRYEGIWARLRLGDDNERREVPVSTKDKVKEAIHLTAKMHFRAVVLKIQHEEDINTEDMKKLHATTRSIPLWFFKVAPYVFLWILLTGGAASAKQPLYRRHFVSEILRLGTSLGIFDWLAFKREST